jgi:glycosyltransferase involved in cell wall biosynthesis
LAKDSIAAIESGYSKKQSFLKRHILFIFYFLLNVVHVLYLSITLRKFRITEKCDQEAVRQIQKIIVNSENVKKRVSLFYGRESVAINPPIETSIFLFKQNDGYWLSVNRITPEKRIEIQTAAFLKLGKEKLIIVGGHEDYHSRYVENLKKQSLENVIFMGSVSQNDLIDLYANCKGLIATSKDEDFGMNAVEAMASGKPVIAPNEGGYKETVTRETGILIDDIDEDKLVEAVKEMNDRISYNCQEIKNACLRRAGEFDTNRFTKKFLLEAGLGA